MNNGWIEGQTHTMVWWMDGWMNGQTVQYWANIHLYPQRRVQAEYLVLGSQKLTELKDMLFCPRDYVITHDYSQTPDLFDRQSLIVSHWTVRMCVLLIDSFRDLPLHQNLLFSLLIILSIMIWEILKQMTIVG